MKLSFSTLGCPDWDLQKTAEKAADYGFDGVELRVDGRQNLSTDMTSEEKKSVKSLFGGKGIEISCISGYSFFCSPNKEELDSNKDLLLSYIDLAADLEVPYIRTFIGNYPETMTEEETAKNAAYYLDICGEAAVRKGTTIIIETHHMFNTGGKVKKILDQIGNNGIAVLWDIHHSHRDRETPLETYQNIDHQIKHIHIKDAYIDKEGVEKHCLVGKGILPIKEVVDLMRDKGFKGHFSLEWEKMWIKELEEPEIAFPQYIEYMNSLCK